MGLKLGLSQYHKNLFPWKSKNRAPVKSICAWEGENDRRLKNYTMVMLNCTLSEYYQYGEDKEDDMGRKCGIREEKINYYRILVFRT